MQEKNDNNNNNNDDNNNISSNSEPMMLKKNLKLKLKLKHKRPPLRETTWNGEKHRKGERESRVLTILSNARHFLRLLFFFVGARVITHRTVSTINENKNKNKTRQDKTESVSE